MQNRMDSVADETGHDSAGAERKRSLHRAAMTGLAAAVLMASFAEPAGACLMFCFP